MNKLTLSETPYGVSLDLSKRGVEAATFLAKNRASVLGPDGIEYLQSAVKPTVSTPLVEIYNKAASLGKLNNFVMVDTTGLPDIPTVLTLEDISIDGKYIAKSMPPAYQKVWVNLTPVLSRRDAYNRNLQISNVTRFANLITKGLLCMGYNDSDMWLSPALSVPVIEAYSALFAMHLKGLFNLNNLEEYNFVRTMFAAYMAQMLDDPKAAKEDVPPLLNRCTFLFEGGSMQDLYQRFEQVAETRKKIAPTGEFNVDVICELIRKHGPLRMQKINTRMLYVLMSRSPMDSQNMMFAMDYPPYFVYLLLNNVRGGKNPLFMNLLKFAGPNMKKRMDRFADDLVANKFIIERISR